VAQSVERLTLDLSSGLDLRISGREFELTGTQTQTQKKKKLEKRPKANYTC